MSDPILEVRAVSAGYGHVPVIRDVSLSVSAGEIVTLIGANGAGKSTLLKAICGLITPTTGQVMLAGEDITGVPPEKLVGRGLALVPEGRMLFGPMTVEENLLLGGHTRTPQQVAESLERVHALFPILRERSGQSAGTLSGGEQQMLAVGRALMSSPRVLLLDEPSLGLAPKVIADIFSVLDELRSSGLAILLIEQDAKLALRHSDRGFVVRAGNVVLEGGAGELLKNDDVRLIYLGAWHGRE